MRYAVVGHTEWVEFARVTRVPAAGEIVEASENWFEPAGGGAVSAVQLAKLAGQALFITAVGDDEIGRRTVEGLEALGVRVAAAVRPESPSRRGFTFVDDGGERTITVLGRKLRPLGSDPLPWNELAGMDAVFFVAGDVAALDASRAARVLVGTAREVPTFAEGRVQLDALVGSGRDEGERYEPGDIDPPPALVVKTSGASGGTWGREQQSGKFRAAELPGPVADAYGCGDSFAAGLTYALGEGAAVEEALALAARCGAHCLTGRGPYSAQLELRPR